MIRGYSRRLTGWRTSSTAPEQSRWKSFDRFGLATASQPRGFSLRCGLACPADKSCSTGLGAIRGRRLSPKGNFDHLSFIRDNALDPPIQLLHYQTRDRRIPFQDWMDSITDPAAFAAIQNRLDRLERGLFGDCKSVGDGVLELRMDVGQGYRAYLARSGTIAVLLLCGGNKSTQRADIKRAKTYWKDHEKRTRAAGSAG